MLRNQLPNRGVLGAGIGQMNRTAVGLGLAGFFILVLAAYAGYLTIRLNVVERNIASDRPVSLRECENGPACPVSFYELVAHPYRYDKKRIKVQGHYVGRFEMSALFPSGVIGFLPLQSAIWIENPGSNVPDKDEISLEVEVVGVFHAGATGHLDQYIGEMRDVITSVAIDHEVDFEANGAIQGSGDPH